MILRLLILFLMLTTIAHADPRDDVRFHDLFLSQVQAMHPEAKVEDLAGLHFIADGKILAAQENDDLTAALKLSSASDLQSLGQATSNLSLIMPATPTMSGARPLTLVIVPGVFAEFIKNRAFEEIFERPSSLRDQFHELVVAQHRTDRVALVNLYRPGQPENRISVERDLDQVIHIGQIELGGQTVRVILFNTEFSSLESLGNSAERAALFTRRLESYLSLTGSQDLAFIGYSRGTPLALEMLAQSYKLRRPWIQNVRGMISLSGVTFGSTLADDTVNNPNSPTGQILNGLSATVATLKFADPKGSLQTRQKVKLANTRKWLDFARKAGLDIARIDQGTTLEQKVSSFLGVVQVNPRSPLNIILRIWKQLGLDHPRQDYNLNIVRFRYFVDQLQASVHELSSGARVDWWKTHNLPKHIIYYAIAAAMANPHANAYEKELFDNPMAYGSGSYDDISLLLNHLDYQRISGIVLNDSQVSVAQAAFLPEVIGRLNPANRGLKTRFLGIAGTHHWGMALREVNEMIFGQRNGFPREAMLRALAEQVELDRPL